MTEQPTTPTTTSDWVAQHAAVTNWDTWPGHGEPLELFSEEHGAAIAWLATRGIDPARTPSAPTIEYGVDGEHRRTVTVEQYVIDADGRRVLDGHQYARTTVTVLDEPVDDHHDHVHGDLGGGRA